MSHIAVRRPRAGRGAALVRIHEEMAEARLAPRHFRLPALDGLAEELDAELERVGEGGIHLVAIDGGEGGGRPGGATARSRAAADRQTLIADNVELAFADLIAVAGDITLLREFARRRVERYLRDGSVPALDEARAELQRRMLDNL